MVHTSASLGRRTTLLIAAVTTVALVPMAAHGAVTAGRSAPSASSASSGAVPLSPCYSHDNGSPVITRVAVNRRVVDVRHHAQRLRVLVDAHDVGGPGPRTGIAGGSVDIEDDDGNYLSRRLVKARPGRWVATFGFPAHSDRDVWYLSVSVVDQAGNSGGLSDGGLRKHGFPDSVSVRSNLRYVPASLRGFRFGRRAVDTRRSAVVVPVRARVTSPLGIVVVRVVAEQVRGAQRHINAYLRRVRGAAPGVFGGQMVIPRWRSTGTWRLSVNAASPSPPDDSWSWQASYLRRHGMRSSFHLVSGTDTTVPKPTAVTPQPATPDVRASARTVTTTVHAVDHGSGVARMVLQTWRWPFSITTELHRVGGTKHDGTWKGTSTIRVCHSVPGHWRTWLTIWDAAGNRQSYGQQYFAAHGITAGIDVQAGDHVAAEVSTRRPHQGPLVVTFAEDVVGISTDSVHVYRAARMINDFEWTDPSPPRPGTWACQDSTGTAVDCLTGPVRVATFTPSTTKWFNEMELNPDRQLAVRDLAGNPYDHFITPAR